MPPAYTGRMPATHYMALLLALLVLVLAGVVLTGHRRREREQREHLRALREREEKLRLALWASNEFYWQYDMQRRELERTEIAPGNGGDLKLHVDLGTDHQIHPDDLQLVIGRLRQYLAGDAPMFLSEHRVRDGKGNWQWMRARGRAIERELAWRASLVPGISVHRAALGGSGGAVGAALYAHDKTSHGNHDLPHTPKKEHDLALDH